MDKLTIEVSESIVLETLELSDAPALYERVDANRIYLRSWLPWLDYNQSVADSEAFIKSTLEDFQSGKSLIFAIKLEDQIIGAVGFNTIDSSNNLAEIGYWLDQSHQGKGVVTSSIKALIRYAQTNTDIRKYQISAGTTNTKSRSIPKRLGFEFIEEVKEAEWLYDHYVDHARYEFRN